MTHVNKHKCTYNSNTVLDTYGDFEQTFMDCGKVLDTYGDFEQTSMNYIAMIRYWIPMVILNRHL